MRPPSHERQHLLPADYDSDGFRLSSSQFHRPKILRAINRKFLATLLGAVCIFGIFIIARRSGSGASPSSQSFQRTGPDIASQVINSMNLSADPCNNFYEYACGGWISNATLPAEKDTYARSFTEIFDRNIMILHEIVKSASTEGDDRVGTLWQSCMDEDAIEDAGMEPLLDQIGKLDPISSLDELFAHIGLMERMHAGFFFDVGVEVDAKDTSKYITTVHQAGLTMGDKFRYVASETNRTAELLEHFKQIRHLTNIKLSQSDIDIDAALQNVVNLEIQIANFTKPNEDLRDPFATYNVRYVHDCKDESGLDFLKYLHNMGFSSLTSNSSINVENPGFLKNMGMLLKSVPLSLLKDSVALRTVISMSEALPRKIRDENFSFFSSTLRGIKKQKPRYKSCIGFVDQLLGDDLGQRFLKQTNFSEKQKKLAAAIVDSIVEEFKSSLNYVSWMDKRTQQAAIDKLHKIKVLVGYPKTWTNYGLLKLELGKFANNVLRSREFLLDDMIARLSQPVDPYRFLMTVPTVNAYYEPTLNSINFPAGILQLPFFASEQSVPLALNYGGIGTVIGHELVHAFDDQGRQYDGNGMLNPWWPDKVANHFKKRADCLGKQYASIEFPDGFHIKPELTMGENIADNGGVSAAFKAFLKARNSEPDDELIPGISNEKLFFIAMAQNWCTIQTKEKLISQLTTDPHSPPLARVHVPLMNSEDFANEFQCPANSDLNPIEKCIIW